MLKLAVRSYLFRDALSKMGLDSLKRPSNLQKISKSEKPKNFRPLANLNSYVNSINCNGVKSKLLERSESFNAVACRRLFTTIEDEPSKKVENKVTTTKLAEILKIYESNPAVQAQMQAAYLQGYRFRLGQAEGLQAPKSLLRRFAEYSLAILFGIWLIDFSIEVAKEYNKLKSKEDGTKDPKSKSESKHSSPSSSSDTNKSGSFGDAGPTRALSMKVDLDIKQTNPEDIETRFTDVKGIDEAKEELQLVVDYLKNPERFSRLGGNLPKGVLLIGKPGVGKTLLAKAVAGEAGVPFFFASGSEFDEVYVGMGARRMRQLFAAAKNAQPCVLFIDEIDSCGAKRISSQMHPFANQTVNQMLTEMDGFSKNSGVIVLAATNRKENLDDALLRPGRFDVEVTVNLPDAKGREDILRHYLSKVKAAKEIDPVHVAKSTPGFTGADFENLVNQAAVHAAKERRTEIKTIDIEWAKDKLTMGPEKKGKIMDPETVKNTAYHEAGHTVVAYFTKAANSIHKVTIIPRGQSLGHTAFVPKNDSNMTKAQLEANLDVAMGGRIGEKMLDEENKLMKGVTTGASSDFGKATLIATAMVKRFGMSEKLGIRVFDDEMLEVSDKTKKIIDDEIHRLLDESFSRASQILTRHHEAHKKLAEALVEEETLSYQEVAKILGPRDFQKQQH